MKRTADSKDDDDDDDDGKKIASDSCVNLIELVQNQRARQFSPAHLNASNANRAGEGEEEDCDNKRAKVVSATTTTTATKVNFGVVEQKPRVLILHTGGTLGMSSDSFEENTVMNTVRSATPMSTISPLSRVASGTSGGENGANSNGAYQRTVKKGTGGHYDNKLGPSRLLTDILSAVPELSAFAKLRVRVLFNKDSCQIVPKDWCFIAEALHEARDEYDAFVLVHGTDTLAYTTSALSLMLANFGKPIIVTGSQLPLAMPRSDARQNLIDAVSCATAGFVHPYISVNEVAVCFGGKLMRGNRVRKVSATIYSAFSSPSYPDLAHLGVGIDFNPQLLLNITGKEYKPRFKINPNVIRISIIPGCDPHIAYEDLYGRGIRGIVLEAFGVGNMPNGDDLHWIPWLRDQRKKGLVVYLSSQCERGTLHPELYMAGSFAIEMGVQGGPMMSPECAVVKLMLALANPDIELTIPIAGEL